MKKYLNNTLYYLFLLLPIIDFITSIYAWNGSRLWFSSILKALLLGVFFLIILKKNNNRKVSFILIIYFIILCLYLLISKDNVLMYVSSLLKIFWLPIALLFFNDYENEKLNVNFIVKVFFLYLLLLIVPYFLGIGHNISEIYVNKEAYLSFFYSGNELSGVLLCLMPIVLDYLKKHHNWLIKIIGFSLILFGIYLLKTKTLVIGFVVSILYLLWKNRNKSIKFIGSVVGLFIVFGCLCLVLVKNFDVALKYYEIDSTKEIFSVKFVDKVLLSSRLSFAGEAFGKLQSKDYLFGVGDVSNVLVKNSEIDIVDIFFSIGIVGLLVYLYLLFYAIRKVKLKGICAFSFYLVLIASLFAGHILNSGMVCIFLSLLVMVNKNWSDKKRILVVSNMYPSRSAKHYGSFVKNMVLVLNDRYDVTLSVMKKKRFFLSKLVGYICFYLKTFVKALFGSYDYIWVHFISHSTAPVLFGYKFCPKTKLILNAHGNDVVADYNFERKNIERSKKYLQVASLVVVSSKYFQERIVKDYNYPIDKIKINHAGGIDLDKFKNLDKNECKEKLGLDVNCNYIGLVSRIEKNKGYDTLLEAMYLIKNEFNVKLLVIGNGSEMAYFNDLVYKYHLEDVVIQKDFVYQSDLVLYYNAFDVLVFPTKRESESLGLVGLEAMACNTFVIGCDLYGPSEYLKNNINSLTYHNTRAKYLARRIRMYYNMSDEERKRIILNGYKTVKDYSKEESLKEILEIIGEL